MKGRCKDCFYLRQEYAVVPNGQTMKIVLDTYCGICGIFKRLDGYCDLWEES